MSLTEDRPVSAKPHARGLALAVAAAALVFAVMAASGVLAVGYAIAGFVGVAAAALLGVRGDDRSSTSSISRSVIFCPAPESSLRFADCWCAPFLPRRFW